MSGEEYFDEREAPMPKHPPLLELLTKYRTTKRRSGFAETTISKRVDLVRSLATWAGPRHVLALDTEDLEQYLDDRRGHDGNGIVLATRLEYQHRLRSFYQWATEKGHIKVNPTNNFEKLSPPKYLPRPARESSIAKALESASPRLVAMISLMTLEGLRCMEVAGLQWSDVDTDAMELRIHGKGNKQRNVPLHPETFDALKAYDPYFAKGLRVDGFVFTHLVGKGRGVKRLAPATVSIMVSGLLPRGTTPHQLRHWFGTYFYNACGDLFLTAVTMGHSSTQTTQGYARVDVSRARDVVNRLSMRPRVDTEEAAG